MIKLLVLCGLLSFLLGASAAVVEPPPDLLPGVPADFPRFECAGDEEAAQVLNRFLWYHFSNRMGNNNCVFNQEYVTLSDMWLGGAMDKARGKAIQAVHKEDLTSILMEPDGYIHTHQHPSSSHDFGWPFPFWSQQILAGHTFGFNFAENPVGMLAFGWGDATNWATLPWTGLRATQGWELENLDSQGIVENKWRLVATGPSPRLTLPEATTFDAYNAPWLQLRWLRSGLSETSTSPYVEWQREGDDDWSPERRVYFEYRPGASEYDHVFGVTHSLFPMYKHPLWQGRIKRLRIALAPGSTTGQFDLLMCFTAYDTRHPVNNPIYLLASCNYFKWTGDLEFLRARINQLRTSLRFMMTEFNTLQLDFVRQSWNGHTGRGNFVLNEDGTKTFRPGQGIGSNYWDILPIGGDDLYTTNLYHKALLELADLEEAVLANPGWGISHGPLALDPIGLRNHAARVREVSNRKFWNPKTGRFAICVDADGRPHDYGFTFVNLDSIWYGLASEDHARAILDWLSGKRLVEGDTSQGEDIYKWRFGPRATTLRNIDWYGQGWTAPESLPWGGQVQDGGAVLGFSFYDLWARLKVKGPDDAWQRLKEIIAWEQECWAAGGYRAFYADGKQGTTLQGGGTAGGLGIDFEFFESSLVPQILIYGFLGIEPKPDGLVLSPNLPSACNELGVSNILYRGCKLNLKASNRRISLELLDTPTEPIHLLLPGWWKLYSTGLEGDQFLLTEPGLYLFSRR